LELLKIANEISSLIREDKKGATKVMVKVMQVIELI